jgi:hypothetical protein
VFKLGQEDIGVGRLFDVHGCDHAVHAHGAKDGHDFPVTARRRPVDASASRTARVEPCHRGSDATLVQENQPLR